MKKCQKIYQFVNQLIVTLLKEGNCSELCLRLFLEAALNAAKSEIADCESISYEFISQAFSIYEEEISDSKEQALCLMLIIASVKNIKFNNVENFIPLRNQCCLNCGKLSFVLFLLNPTILLFISIPNFDLFSMSDLSLNKFIIFL